MKRTLLLGFTLVLLVVGFVFAGSGRESTQLPPQEVEIMYSSEDHAYQMKDLSDVVRWKVLPDGAMSILDSSAVTRFTVDSSGNIKTLDSSSVVDSYFPSDRVVYITTPSQLSTWTGQASTAGQSYFQCEPGKTYIVDPYAIATSGCAPNGTTAMGTFSAVSAILPDGATYYGPAYDVTVLVMSTGATGYVTVMSGNTNVQVWPYAGMAGLTAYGQRASNYAVAYRSGCTPQSLLTVYQASGATISAANYQLRTGASYWELDRMGESAVFGTGTGSVSSFVKQRYLNNK